MPILRLRERKDQPLRIWANLEQTAGNGGVVVGEEVEILLDVEIIN